MTERDLPSRSAVSWSAVFAGAVTALAAGIVLTGLAAGFGFRLAVAGLASRASLEGFSPEAGAWMIAAQVLPAALGGYLAGRLRLHWQGVHGDETHFRDTAHGLLAWAVGTVAGVVLAALVLLPYADRLAGAEAAAPALSSAQAAVRAVRDAEIASQSAIFVAVGLLLAAFTSAVAAALGGLRTDEMHGKG